MSAADIEKGSVDATSPHQALASAAAPRPRPRTANPATLGLFSFASTTLILSLYNAATRGILHPNAVVGMAIFCGGLAQLLAGMWEFPTGNAFGAAGKDLSPRLFPFSLWDDSGILSLNDLTTVVALGKNIGFIALFGFLTTTFACLAGGELGASPASTKAGGILGVITAFIAYYIGLSELLETEAHPPFRLPIGHLHPKKD
ncbi:hypothetical protein C0995_001207 [Termitomyces sp. Mi166|nr:hypothetical protein C0995_001207 [Termitomyces sp. Mi166\